MSIIPSLGRLGANTPPGQAAQPNRQEIIRSVWTFILGLTTKRIKITDGASSGAALVSDAVGNASWSTVVPHATSAGLDATANEAGTLVTGASGTYLVSVYHQVSTAGTGGTLTTTITHTDDLGSTSWQPAAALACTATGRSEGYVVVRCASGDLDFVKAITGGTGTPHYKSHITAVKVST